MEKNKTACNKCIYGDIIARCIGGSNRYEYYCICKYDRIKRFNPITGEIDIVVPIDYEIENEKGNCKYYKAKIT